MKLHKVIAIDDNPANDRLETQDAMTMRATKVDTSQFKPSSAFNFSEPSKNPMTQRPVDDSKEDNNVCITAHVNALAEYSGLTVAQLLDSVQRAAVIARANEKKGKDWAKTSAANPNFREDIHTHPVKNQKIFEENSNRIAAYFANKKVSPDGLGQAIKKLNYYLVRGGSNIPHEKRVRVHKAIMILHERNLHENYSKGKK